VAPRVSLCLIAKDEAPNLPACLASAAGLADEVVVVDTGSTDATREVAARLGARVFDFPWCDSFAAARNEGLRHATGDWVFWLDADDRLDDDNRAKLRALLQALPEENVGFLMRCRGTPDAGTLTGMVVTQLRLFRRQPGVAWQYRVHEQVWPSLARHGDALRPCDVVLRHTGYADPAARRRKRQRNLRLLERDHAERPDDPFVLYNLGAVHEEDGRPDRALPLLRRAVALAPAGAPFAAAAHLVLARTLGRLGQPAAALAACRAGRRLGPRDPGLLFQEAVLLGEQGDPAGEEACLRSLLDGADAGAAIYDAGLGAYQARHNLAVLCRDQGRLAEAEALWRAAVAAAPGFGLGWRGLAELYLAQGLPGPGAVGRIGGGRGPAGGGPGAAGGGGAAAGPGAAGAAAVRGGAAPVGGGLGQPARRAGAVAAVQRGAALGGPGLGRGRTGATRGAGRGSRGRAGPPEPGSAPATAGTGDRPVSGHLARPSPAGQMAGAEAQPAIRQQVARTTM
jgi:tetratricopeptide (TPR) repeat protein